MQSNTKWDWIILGTASIAVSGAVMSILFNEKGFTYVEGAPRYEAALGVVYAVIGCYSLAHFRDVIQVMRRSSPMIATLALAFASMLWAENPALALRRSFALFGSTLLGVLLATRFTSEERLTFLSYILRGLALTSLLFAVFLPSYGVMDDLLHAGDWNGVFNNKNDLGAYIAMAFLIDCFRPMKRPSTLFWFGLYTVLLVKSDSASPIAALVATYIIVKLFHRLRTRHRLSVRAITLSILGGIAICGSAILGSGLLQSLFGRTSDLSGRTELWRALVPTILLHPFLGYGYGAFWAGGSSEYYTVQRLIHWDPMYSHNGFFEITISLGILGLILACWFLTQAAIYAVRRSDLTSADIQTSMVDRFPLALMAYVLIRNMTEATIFHHNSLEWAICAATALDVLAARKTMPFEKPMEQEAEDTATVEEYA